MSIDPKALVEQTDALVDVVMDTLDDLTIQLTDYHLLEGSEVPLLKTGNAAFERCYAYVAKQNGLSVDELKDIYTSYTRQASTKVNTSNINDDSEVEVDEYDGWESIDEMDEELQISLAFAMESRGWK